MKRTFAALNAALLIMAFPAETVVFAVDKQTGTCGKSIIAAAAETSRLTVFAACTASPPFVPRTAPIRAESAASRCASDGG